ncbi:MAG TPA: rhombosortase [Woeseiaceae bacterium]|nr:rhombosortase [Woeseiaceae bacterium]
MGLRQREPGPESANNWWPPVVVSLVAVVAQVLATGAPTLLRFDRAAIRSGEVWRLVSGHLVHLGWSHLLMNVIGLLLVFGLVGAAFRTAQWVLVALITIVVIDFGFWFLLPGLNWYVGLSGLLHGLLGAGIVGSLMQGGTRHWELWILAVLVAVKLVYEHLSGALPGSAGVAGGNVIVEAHLYGAIGGVAAGLLVSRFSQRQHTVPHGREPHD